jgi:hypothetical protein
MTRGGTERDLTPPHACTVAEASSGTGVESAFALELPLPLRANPVELGAANVPTLATNNAGNDLVEARGLAQAEQQRGAALVNGRTEIRVTAGLQRARAQGKRLGRPRKVRSTVVIPGGSVRQAALAWGVSKSTAARWINGGRLVHALTGPAST